MNVREFLDLVEEAVLKGLDKTKEGVSTAKEKTADAVEEMEKRINKRNKINAIKASNKHRARYSKKHFKKWSRLNKF